MTNRPQPWADIPATGPLLRPKDAAAYLGYSKPRYYVLADRGELPKPIKIGRGFGGLTGVPKGWLDAIIAAAAMEATR